jgi:hypothetical protein
MNDLKQAIQPDPIVYYLGRSELLIPYLREVIIEQTLATWEKSLTPKIILSSATTAKVDELAITPVEPAPPEISPTLTPAQRQAALLQQYKEMEWGHLVISRFLASKSQLDLVLFSTIQVSDLHLAQELYCEICEQGQSFARLAAIHSQCPTAKKGGATGPILVSKLHPLVKYYVTHLAPKQISPVFKLDSFYTFVRLDRWLPAQFTPQMRQQLLDCCFEEWLQQEIADLIGDIYVSTLTSVPELPPEPDPITAPATLDLPDFTDGGTSTSALRFPNIIPTNFHTDESSFLIVPSSLLFPQLPPSLSLDPIRSSKWTEKITTYLSVKVRNFLKHLSISQNTDTRRSTRSK